jgi:hypothetical protein
MKKLLLSIILTAISLSAYAQQSGNISATLLPSAARTAASVNSADITNSSWKGAHVIITTSAFTSGTYTPTIQGKDPVTGNYYTILTGAAITGTGTVVLRVYPGITATANVSASDFLPRVWRVNLVGASTPSMTFSVGAFLEQ